MKVCFIGTFNAPGFNECGALLPSDPEGAKACLEAGAKVVTMYVFPVREARKMLKLIEQSNEANRKPARKKKQKSATSSAV